MPSSLLWRLFWIAFGLRLVAAVAINWSGSLFSGLSRDSAQYHEIGIQIANALALGESGPRASWIDHAWFRLIGHLYYWLTPEPFLIQLLNVILGSVAAVMTARMAWLAYGDARVAYFAGWLMAVFPSFVYYSALLLKDAASLFLMACLGWAVVALRQRFSWLYVAVIAACLLGYLGVREYMFFMGMILVSVSMLPFFGRSSVSIAGLTALLIVLSALTWSTGYGFWGQSFFQESQYLDIEYINETREGFERGTGAMGASAWGEDLATDLRNALMGVYYFLFSVNPFEIKSVRQLFALPEMLLMLSALMPMYRGFMVTWLQFRGTAIALIVFGTAVLAIYTSATTNMGALYRWRMQAFPFLFAILAAGLMLSRGNPLELMMRGVTRPAKRWMIRGR